MHSLFIEKPLSALHVWVWIPVPLGTSQELVHSVEHRIFLDSKIAALEDETVRHNGMTFWSGIRLEFTIPPARFAELEIALAELFKKPLPKMSFEERERFARELEEGGGDTFDRALDRFRSAFSEANGLKHSGKDEDAIWASLDFSAVRLLAVGEVDVASEGGSGSGFESATFEPYMDGDEPEAHRVAPDDFRHRHEEGATRCAAWLPSSRPDLVFPTLKEELADKPEDEEEYGLGESDPGMDYVLMFPSIVEDARDFAFHALFLQHVRIRTDIDFRDTGRTYDPAVEDYFEDGFAVSGIHLITSDTSKKLPALPKKPSEKEFLKTRDSLAFQNAIFVDQLLYGSFPVLGIPPEDALAAIASYPYADFAERFDRAVARVSTFWGIGG